MPTAPKKISDRLIADITDRLAKNRPIRRTLPDGGRIHIDRQLPFLALYRPPADIDDPGTASLIKGQASYLIAPALPQHNKQVVALATAVAEEMATVFGAFLIIEIWAKGQQEPNDTDRGVDKPRFKVIVGRHDAEAPGD